MAVHFRGLRPGATLASVRFVRAQGRHDLRRHWRALVALGMLVGLVGGTVLATAAGARRTASSYTRLLDHVHAEDVNLGLPGANDPAFAEAVGAIEAFPEVEAVAPITSQELYTEDPGFTFFALGGLDDRFGRLVNRPKVLEGRDADPDEEAELTVNRDMADALDLEPGDELTLYGFPGGTTESEDTGRPQIDQGRRQVFTVTGIVVQPNEVVPSAPLDDAPRVYLTTAQVQRHLDEAEEFAFLAIRLRAGAEDVGVFRDHLAELARQFGVSIDEIPFSDAGRRRSTVQRAIRPQAQALGAFSLLVALTGLVVIGQAYARHLSVDLEDRRTLHALGADRRQLTLVAVARVALSVVGGAVLAVGLAILVAPQTITGPAAIADPSDGVFVDVPVLVAGAVGIVVLIVAWAAVAIRRRLPGPSAVRRDSRGRRRRGATTTVARAGLSAPATVGLQMAVQPDDSRALGSAGALVGTVVAIAATVGALTYGASLDRLVSTPSLYGWTWDVQAGGAIDPLPDEEVIAALGTIPDVDAVSGGTVGELVLTGPGGERRQVPGIGLDRIEGDIHPVVVEGRAGSDGDEVVLGSSTMDQLDADLGDGVVLTGPDGDEHRLEVVGRAVMPAIGAGNFTTSGLGEGAIVPARLLDTSGVVGAYTYFLVGFSPDADISAATADVEEALEPLLPPCGRSCIQGPQQPGDVRDAARVKGTPVSLAVVLVVLALAVLVHTLVTTVRHWRRDLGVLVSLGFVRRQRMAATTWHAVTVAGAALLVGVPAGIVLGRLLWREFVGALGVEAPAVTPWPTLVGAAAVIFFLAVVTAGLAAISLRRQQPAAVLREG